MNMGDIDKICPICGKDNNCKHNKDCWCTKVTVPKGLIDLIPKEKRGTACVCKECIDKYNLNNK